MEYHFLCFSFLLSWLFLSHRDPLQAYLLERTESLYRHIYWNVQKAPSQACVSGVEKLSTGNHAAQKLSACFILYVHEKFELSCMSQ